MKKEICFDVDGVLCPDGYHGRFEEAPPYPQAIKFVNRLYDSGWTIYILTARGMRDCDNNVIDAYMNYFDITFKWLKKHGFKFHQLHLGKPPASYYVDNKAFQIQSCKGEEDWAK